MTRASVVIGVGNEIRRDDAVGVLAVRRLAARGLPGVTLLEGGTAGLLLYPALTEASRAVLVDAVDHGAPPGAFGVFPPDAYAALVRTKGVHDVGLDDLLAAAVLAGTLPTETVIVGVQPADLGLGVGLSPAVAAGLERVVELVARLAQGVGAVSPSMDSRNATTFA